MPAALISVDDVQRTRTQTGAAPCDGPPFLTIRSFWCFLHEDQAVERIRRRSLCPVEPQLLSFDGRVAEPRARCSQTFKALFYLCAKDRAYVIRVGVVSKMILPVQCCSPLFARATPCQGNSSCCLRNIGTMESGGSVFWLSMKTKGFL